MTKFLNDLQSSQALPKSLEEINDGMPIFKDKAANRLILCYSGMLASWCLDFRSASAGSGLALQSIYLGLFSIFFLAFLVSGRKKFRSIKSRRNIVISALFFLVETSAVAMVNGQDFYAIATNSVGLVILCCIMFTTSEIARISNFSAKLYSNIIIFSLLYAIARVSIVFFTNGIVISKTRYEILGSSTIACLALLPLIIVFPIRKINLMSLIFTVSVTLISVTRTYVIVLLAQFFVYHNSIIDFIKMRNIFNRIVIALLLPILVIGADILLGTGVSERWVVRLFYKAGLSFDPTNLTRIAEVNFMKDAFLQSSWTVLFGNGLAAPTSLIGREASMAAMLVGRGSVEFHSIGFGHNNYWSMLFVGGILGSFPLFYSVFWLAWQSATFYKNAQKKVPGSDLLLEMGAWGAVIIIGTLAYGFFGGIFNNRGQCLWFGIGIGLLLASRSSLKQRIELECPT